MRNAFAKEITKIAKKNKKIILLSGDIGNKLFDEFKKTNVKRFINCGVAESNMTTVAAGLANIGFIPLTYTIASFNVYKTVEQIKLDICYQNKPVIIVGVGSGLGYSNLGTTHHSIEDIGVLNSLPNLNIICPADSNELVVLLRQIISSKKPTYLRLGKKNEPLIFKNRCTSKLGIPTTIRKGKKICIFGTGNILKNAINASDVLTRRKIFPQIINIHSIKPINETFIKKTLKKFKKIIIVDDGSTDKTLDVAEEIKSTIDPDVQIIINKKNIGPSGSIKNFINQMNEGKLFVISGDNDLDKFLIKNLILGSLQADFVLSYYLNREEKGWLRANISTLFNLILCTFFRVYAFYLQGPVVWPIKIVKDFKIFSNGIAYASEVNIKLLRSGLNFVEVSGYMNTGSANSTSLKLKNFIDIIKTFVSLFWEIMIKRKFQLKSKRLKFIY